MSVDLLRAVARLHGLEVVAEAANELEALRAENEKLRQWRPASIVIDDVHIEKLEKVLAETTRKMLREAGVTLIRTDGLPETAISRGWKKLSE